MQSAGNLTPPGFNDLNQQFEQMLEQRVQIAKLVHGVPSSEQSVSACIERYNKITKELGELKTVFRNTQEALKRLQSANLNPQINRK